MRVAALAMIAMLTPSVAQAGDGCVPPADFAALLTAVAPVVIDTAAKSCATAGHPLAAAAPLAARWQNEAEAAWPAARAAADRMGKDAFPKELSDEALRPLVRDIIGSMLAKEIRADSCAPIDGLLREATSLTAGGFSRMVVALIRIASPTKSGGLSICAEPAR